MEIWKPIEDYPMYEISSLGRIRSFMKGEPSILAGGADKDGYRMILLYHNKKRVTRRIHRLVAQAFLPNPYKCPTVNHLNGIKDDNRLENLEWATHSRQRYHAFDTGLADMSWKKRPVRQIDIITGKTIREYESITEPTKYGFNRGKVGDVCRGERRTHGGYKWEYI